MSLPETVILTEAVLLSIGVTDTLVEDDAFTFDVSLRGLTDITTFLELPANSQIGNDAYTLTESTPRINLASTEAFTVTDVISTTQSVTDSGTLHEIVNSLPGEYSDAGVMNDSCITLLTGTDVTTLAEGLTSILYVVQAIETYHATESADPISTILQPIVDTFCASVSGDEFA